jgi:peroxiredoxin
MINVIVQLDNLTTIYSKEFPFVEPLYCPSNSDINNVKVLSQFSNEAKNKLIYGKKSNRF